MHKGVVFLYIILYDTGFGDISESAYDSFTQFLASKCDHADLVDSADQPINPRR